MSQTDTSSLTREDATLVVAADRHDIQKWHCATQLEKLHIPSQRLARGDTSDLAELHRASMVGATMIGAKTVGEVQYDLLRGVGVEPELVDVDGNLLMYGGASNQWQTLIGNGTATAGALLTFFSNAQAAIGVGDTATAAAATQNDLTATTNKLRVAMDATYPQHTDGVTSAAASIQFRSSYATGQANWAWNEWGIFNSATAATGRMLQRKVESLGTKVSGVWTLTLTLTIA